jgi:hypothetical protein
MLGNNKVTAVGFKTAVVWTAGRLAGWRTVVLIANVALTTAVFENTRIQDLRSNRNVN